MFGPPHQHCVLPTKKASSSIVHNQLQRDLLGRESMLAGKDWGFPAYPAFTELHVPLCLRRGKLG